MIKKVKKIIIIENSTFEDNYLKELGKLKENKINNYQTTLSYLKKMTYWDENDHIEIQKINRIEIK